MESKVIESKVMESKVMRLFYKVKNTLTSQPGFGLTAVYAKRCRAVRLGIFVKY